MLPTIHTVAQQAGESIPTTSRILKDYLVGVFSQGNGNPEAYLP